MAISGAVVMIPNDPHIPTPGEMDDDSPNESKGMPNGIVNASAPFDVIVVLEGALLR